MHCAHGSGDNLSIGTSCQLLIPTSLRDQPHIVRHESWPHWPLAWNDPHGDLVGEKLIEWLFSGVELQDKVC